MQATWVWAGVRVGCAALAVLAVAGCGQGGGATNAASDAPSNAAAAPATASVPISVPFVGCPADGQTGPQPAPSGQPITVALVPAMAGKLAYYSATNIGAVLAPAGWHCFAAYGSSGGGLYVAPGPITFNDVNGSGWAAGAGPSVEVSWVAGDTSGRFEVAQAIARLFPTQMAFAQKVIAEDVEPASSFPKGPFLQDQLTRRGDDVVEYETPAGARGLGTTFSQLTSGTAIDGVALLQGPTPDLVFLAARLPANDQGLVAVIESRLEADSGPGPDEASAPPATGVATPGRGPLATVQAFYAALGEGDGAKASNLVVPEKRAGGPFSAAQLTSYYGAMREPVTLRSVTSAGGGAVQVRYRYVLRTGRVCDSAAVVQTTTQDGQTLISGITGASC
jgi:hypothetical protein